jgi:maltooligosyltrehalose trehalohydrolase
MTRFGAYVVTGGVEFRLWTDAPEFELVAGGEVFPQSEFQRLGGDSWRLFLPGLAAGTRYGYRLRGEGPFPDPASRYQPDGVHALSEVIDPAFDWTDEGFSPVPWKQTVFYELHCGAFTPEGTFRAAAEKLSELKELGVTAIELMPIADFPGRWNWGYDGVSLWAPSRAYGRPEDLRAFVDRAHAHGLAVYLDVVFNHLGPDGAYHRLFHSAFYREGRSTPWGDALNFDTPGSRQVRDFFIGSALHWLEEYHIDGFRLDATHAIVDDSHEHFLAELTRRVHARAGELKRECRLVAEDARNLIRLLEPSEQSGYGLDAVWADDFHHQVRRATAGDHHGYYSDYTGEAAAIVPTLNDGWFYCGQQSHYHGAPRGTPTGPTPRHRFVICIQNHDQIGNRARGDRLNHGIDPGVYLAASALLLLAPETPLLFMGQEWSATTPFAYFTDHNAELGRAVTLGRYREFSHFPEFATESGRATIPDPQAEATFRDCQLRWDERNQADHQAVLRWYTDLLALRQTLIRSGKTCTAEESERGEILLWWRDAATEVRLRVSLAAPIELSPSDLQARSRVLLQGSHCVIVEQGSGDE